MKKRKESADYEFCFLIFRGNVRINLQMFGVQQWAKAIGNQDVIGSKFFPDIFHASTYFYSCRKFLLTKRWSKAQERDQMYYLKRPLKAKVSTVFIPNECQKLQVALKHRNSASPGRTKLHNHSIKTSPTNTNMFYH